MKEGFELFPDQASTFAGQVDGVTISLLLISGFVLAVVFGLILVFGILYRKGSPRSREFRKKGQLTLEWGWTFATFFVFLGIFAWAAFIYFNMHAPPPDAAEIMVVGKQWMWKFQHPNGKRELDELHVPVNKPILLTMTSQDVIHSFFVPEFRIKQDVLPGRYSRVWFQANRPGQYHLFCTQYCGTLHAGMRGTVFVLSQSDYQQWLQSGSLTSFSGTRIEESQSMASRGGRLFTRLGCISCHGINPGAMAPTLHGIYGKLEGLSDGTSIRVDENYVRESILNPRAKIVKGYAPIMPSYAGLVSEEDVLDLIAYIKSLKDTPMSESPAGPSSQTSLPSPPPLVPSHAFGVLPSRRNP